MQSYHWLIITDDTQANENMTLPRGHDRMIVGFTTTYTISAYHH